MSVDLSTFHAAFFEEAAEHLAEMERLVIELDLDNPNADALNAIFRAAHSIKGGSGTFGFGDMAEVTHVLESVLDRLRKGEMMPTSAMVDAFLAAGDVLQGQLDAHRGGQPTSPGAAADIIQRLGTFLTESAGSPFTGDVAVSFSYPEDSAPAVDADDRLSRRLRVIFTLPDGGVGARGLQPLLEEWEQRGTVEVVSRPDSESGGGRWEIQATTQETEENLREELAYYVDPADVEFSLLEEEGQGYGFFVALPPLESIDGEELTRDFADLLAGGEEFGFFPGAPGAPAPVEEGFGFFEGAPGSPDDLHSAIIPPQKPKTVPYGFFPGAPGAPNAPSPTQEAAPYGLFPGAPGAPKSGVVGKSPSEAPSSPDSKTTRPADGGSIRVGVEKVDQLMNLVGELVITQSMLAQIASQMDPLWAARLQAGLDQLERYTRSLQESVMSIRMMPISVVFSRFPRLVRDLAAKLGKRVELSTLGEGTELDKGLTERLIDPLTHLVRNSLDHGIEPPETRVDRGKDPIGRITLSASHQGGNVVIEVRDDGAGLDRDRILAKARERGVDTSDVVSDQDVWQIIFAPGFSTAEHVTDVSGRGVGMDVVRRNIQEMGGTVDIASAAGLGSTFTVRLPLTLAILDGMSVAVGQETFIIPLGYIMESLRPLAADIRTVSGRGRVVLVRGEYLPILPLHEVFSMTPLVTSPEDGILVLLEAEGRRVALFVDQLVGQHQVVIKSLESNFRRVDGISGATIMGDGRVALILDVGQLVRRTGRGGGTTEAAA